MGAMFERYTERARRVIFFARYEASQFGSTIIGTEFLLLGILREDRNMGTRFLSPVFTAEHIREKVEARLSVHEKVSTSIDLPLSEESRHILGYAADEAQQLNQRHIGTEHLLLGILREEKCAAAQVLNEIGFDLNTVRERMAREVVQQATPPSEGEGLRRLQEIMPDFFSQDPSLPAAGVVPDAETAERIAEATWIPLFGESMIASQKPFQTERRFSVWIVSGKALPETALYVFISQKTGRVLAVGRGQPVVEG
jgi:ATP-dependent Clp protease ATP-binding subunit ClpA